MKTVVITGTNRGLGLGFVTHYLEAGWKVIAINRHDSEALSALKANAALTCLRAELTDEGDLARVAGELGSTDIDLLIHNAGVMGDANFRREVMQKQSLADFAREEWRKVFEINVFTPVQLTALLAPRLKDGATVVTLSSQMGSIEQNSFGGWYAYRASKAAVNGIMKSMSLELADRGIIAIAMHPGWVRTDMGGPDADIDTDTAIDGMTGVIAGLTLADSGRFLGYNGDELPY